MADPLLHRRFAKPSAGLRSRGRRRGGRLTKVEPAARSGPAVAVAVAPRLRGVWGQRMRAARIGPLGAAAALLVGLGMLSACTAPSPREAAPSGGGAGAGAAVAAAMPSQSASGDPLLAFLAEAEEGAVRDFDDAAAGVRLRVRAGRLYHAASGRVCRQYRVSNPAVPEANEEGLACRDRAGHWRRTALVAPTASP